LKRAIIGLFFLGLLLINTFLILTVHASVTLTQYDGRWGQAFFYPLDEIVTFDVPTKNLTYPGPYPYVFTLNSPLHLYLQIRHFLWAYNGNYSNHLIIQIDGQSVLEAYSPRATGGWYPGSNGVQLIDLGMRSAGTHFMTMTCNISDYYAVDWWEILYIPSTVPRTPAYSV
jgi:hypothetical protein